MLSYDISVGENKFAKRTKVTYGKAKHAQGLTPTFKIYLVKMKTCLICIKNPNGLVY